MEIKITHEMDIREVREFMDRWSALANYDALDELTAYCGDMYDFEYALDGMDIEDVDSYFADGDYADAVINWLEDIDDGSLNEEDYEKVCDLLDNLGMDDYIDEAWLDKPLTPEEELIDEHAYEFDKFYNWMLNLDLYKEGSEEVDDNYYENLKIETARILMNIAVRLGTNIEKVTDFQAFVEFARQYAELEMSHDVEYTLYNFCSANDYKAKSFIG